MPKSYLTANMSGFAAIGAVHASLLKLLTIIHASGPATGLVGVLGEGEQRAPDGWQNAFNITTESAATTRFLSECLDGITFETPEQRRESFHRQVSAIIDSCRDLPSLPWADDQRPSSCAALEAAAAQVDAGNYHAAIHQLSPVFEMLRVLAVSVLRGMADACFHIGENPPAIKGEPTVQEPTAVGEGLAVD